MKKLFAHVDALLRGEYTRREDLRAGRIAARARTLAGVGAVLGLVYGAFMGLYGALRPETASIAQLLATTVKVPLLFLLTLVVTFPSLYVVSALARSPLRMHDSLRLLLVAVTVNLALVASLGPVTGFFTLSTESYPFMVLLNVAFFAISGFVGLRFLLGALDAVFSPAALDDVPPASVADEDSDAESRAEQASDAMPDDGDGDGDDSGAEEDDGASDARLSAQATGWRDASALREAEEERFAASQRARRVFTLWTVIYGVVGAQMGWILRPFIGSPTQPFELFRERNSHFFAAVLETLGRLFE